MNSFRRRNNSYTAGTRRPPARLGLSGAILLSIWSIAEHPVSPLPGQVRGTASRRGRWPRFGTGGPCFRRLAAYRYAAMATGSDRRAHVVESRRGGRDGRTPADSTERRPPRRVLAGRRRAVEARLSTGVARRGPVSTGSPTVLSAMGVTATSHGPMAGSTACRRVLAAPLRTAARYPESGMP
jgi:hypothetical protein